MFKGDRHEDKMPPQPVSTIQLLLCVLDDFGCCLPAVMHVFNHLFLSSFKA